MTVREIRIFGDPVLKTVSEPVTSFDDRLRILVDDLLDSVRLPGRAGVAAAQIGVNLRAFSYHVEGRVGYIVNPVLCEVSGEPEYVDEGCLSVPDLWFPTKRYPFARVVGVDLNGEPSELSGTGLLAQALQHEMDHLEGVLYLDRLDPEDRRAAMRQIRESSWW